MWSKIPKVDYSNYNVARPRTVTSMTTTVCKVLKKYIEADAVYLLNAEFLVDCDSAKHFLFVKLNSVSLALQNSFRWLRMQQGSIVCGFMRHSYTSIWVQSWWSITRDCLNRNLKRCGHSMLVMLRMMSAHSARDNSTSIITSSLHSNEVLFGMFVSRHLNFILDYMN